MAHVTGAEQEVVEHRAPTDTIEVEPLIEKIAAVVAVLALWTEPETETETEMTLGCVIGTGNYTVGSIFAGEGVSLSPGPVFECLRSRRPFVLHLMSNPRIRTRRI